MYNKQRSSGVATWIRILLILMVCGGITAAFITIIAFVAAFTGWFVCCIGLYVFTVITVAKAMWHGLDGSSRRSRRPRYRR